MSEENINQEEAQPKADASKEMKADVEKNEGGVNAIAILSYLGILFLVPLLAAKDDNFAQFHAKQGLVLFLAWVVFSFINVIPLLGQLIFVFGSLFFFVLSIIGIINVLSGKKKEIPLIGQYADKFKV